MGTFYWAISDIRRNKRFLFFFIVSFTCACIMLSMIYFQYRESASNSSTLKNLDNRNITAFSIQYTTQQSNLYFQNKEREKFLENGYSIVQRTTGEYNITYLLGDGDLADIVPEDINIQSRDVLIGADMNKEEVKTILDQENIVYDRILELTRDKRIVTKYNLSQSLNTSVIVYLNMDDAQSLLFTNDEIVDNFLMIDADKQQIENFVRQINVDGDIQIEAFDYIQKNQDITSQLMQDSIFYFLIFFACLLIFIIMMLVNNYILVDMKVKEYTIHIAYGATLKDILTRVLIYNTLIIGTSVFLYIIVNSLYRFSLDNNMVFILSLSFVSWCILSVLPIIRLRKKNLFENMRGDYS